MPIRPATTGDIDSIREVAERTWVEAYSGIMEETDLERRVLEEGFYSRDYLEDDLEDEKTIFLVYEIENEVIGFSHLEYRDQEPDGSRREHSSAELRKLYVDPGHWRQGIGSRLLEKSIEVLPGYIGHIKAVVLKENTRAKNFYREKEFRKVDEEEVTIWGENYVTDIMLKEV
jgi:ribosomal protein S18 acetylase RimI-like enzyme